MNIPMIKLIFNEADAKDYIYLQYGNREIHNKRSCIDYQILGNGYYLKIRDKCKRETYLIKTDAIDVMKIVEPKWGRTMYRSEKNKGII